MNLKKQWNEEINWYIHRNIRLSGKKISLNSFYYEQKVSSLKQISLIITIALKRNFEKLKTFHYFNRQLTTLYNDRQGILRSPKGVQISLRILMMMKMLQICFHHLEKLNLTPSNQVWPPVIHRNWRHQWKESIMKIFKRNPEILCQMQWANV